MRSKLSSLHPLINMYDHCYVRSHMMRSWLLLIVHSLLGDIILLTSTPTNCAAGLPTCCQGLCEDTCAISAASFIVDFWMLNRTV
jgi:hypothetical protein